jgi:hypothetical protein
MVATIKRSKCWLQSRTIASVASLLATTQQWIHQYKQQTENITCRIYSQGKFDKIVLKKPRVNHGTLILHLIEWMSERLFLAQIEPFPAVSCQEYLTLCRDGDVDIHFILVQYA